jgi:DnaD/phage-associated family protein
VESLGGAGESTEEALRQALAAAVKRRTILHVRLGDGASEDIYLINNEANQKAVLRIQSGTLKLDSLKAAPPEPAAAGPPPDIFKLYEDNIGILTPLVADELRDAEKLYPEDWIRDAIKEAVAVNKRNIRYITRILERWSTEGKTDGTHQRHPQTGPEKYVKGKYGDLVQR